MEITRSKMNRRVPLIGQLMVSAGLVDENAVNQALEISRSSDQRIGRVMIMTGAVREPQLATCLHAQKMIKEGLVSAEVAKAALARACKQGVSLEDALHEVGWQPHVSMSDEVGDYLLGSGFITKELYAQAIKDSRDANQMMGRYLVFKGAIPSSALAAVLESMQLITEGSVSKEQAVQALSLMRSSRGNLENSLAMLEFYSPIGSRIRLGQLLMSSGVMTDNEVLECLERAIRDQKALAAVLAEGNHASVHLIEAASKLETLVTMQLISKDEATETLKQLHKMGGPADQAIDRLTADKYASNQAKLGVSLLVQSGAINARLAERSVHALVAAGLVDQQLLGSAMACAYFIESGSLKLEHAVIALQYCQRTRGGLEDAIRDLKMTDMLAAPSKKQMVTHKMQKPVFNSEGLPMVFEPRPEGPNQKQRLLTTAILSVICLALALGTFAVPGALPAGVAREGSRYAMIALIIGLIFVIAQQWRAKAEPANDDHLRLRVRSGRTSENPRL